MVDCEMKGGWDYMVACEMKVGLGYYGRIAVR